MQGTGTQTDPYIPGNWEEFVTAIGTTGAYVELPEGGGTFDMNEIAPTGVGIITANCEEINGNGWTIDNAYNMYFNLEEIYRKNKYIKNFHIKDFTIENSTEPLIKNTAADYYWILKDCQISGKRVSGGSKEIFNAGIRFYSCGLNIAFGGNEHFLFDHDYYNRAWGYFCNVRLDYTGCTIDFDVPQESRDGNAYAFDNSFLRIRTNPDKTQKTAFYSGSVNDIILLDNKNIVIDSTGTSHEVTDEQVRNPAYLNSIGFPIAAEG